MTVVLSVVVYAVAMTGANLLVAAFGPHWLVLGGNAFLLIGLDLALRDLLHVRLTRWQMLALILFAGLLTFALAPGSWRIAAASSAAFASAALADWLTFTRSRGSWLQRSNKSNVAGAAVDSLLFPLLAFGALMPDRVALLFVAKVAGGAAWSLLIARFARKVAP